MTGKVRQERVEALLLALKVEEGGHESRNVGTAEGDLLSSESWPWQGAEFCQQLGWARR